MFCSAEPCWPAWTFSSSASSLRAARLESRSSSFRRSTIEVRQLGSTDVDQLPAPILEVGQDYLLFLTPTGLSGGAASQFYITGGTAGYYRSTAGPTGDRADAGATFGKVGDEGDTLPTTLTADQIP